MDTILPRYWLMFNDFSEAGLLNKSSNPNTDKPIVTKFYQIFQHLNE
jgi:hypothetical protein